MTAELTTFQNFSLFLRNRKFLRKILVSTLFTHYIMMEPMYKVELLPGWGRIPDVVTHDISKGDCAPRFQKPTAAMQKTATKTQNSARPARTAKNAGDVVVRKIDRIRMLVGNGYMTDQQGRTAESVVLAKEFGI
jgi:hypothetical protein